MTAPTLTSAPPPRHDPDRWKSAVIYQVCPRSFADANDRAGG